MIDIKIKGIGDLQRTLDSIPKELQRNAYVAALRGGLKPLSQKAKSLAPVGDGAQAGLLRKAIGYRVKKVRGRLSARVGVRTGFGVTVGKRADGRPLRKDPNHYAHLLERGASKASARPFIRPALDSGSRAALDGMADGLGRYVKNKLRALRRKRGAA